MPEINHKDQPSIPATPLPKVASPATITTTADLEKAVEAFLAKKKTEAKEAAKPKEPDWSTLQEKDIYSQDVYIPVIEHEIPDYMNMMLKDTEYVPVWVSKDQRNLGRYIAEGYEFLKKEHVDPKFALPLLFNSEGLYIYQDVICLRVHKRILFGKRRRALEVSQRQLNNNRRPPRSRETGTFNIPEAPALEQGFSFYDPVA